MNLPEKRLAIGLILASLVLLGAAGGILAHNRREDLAAGQASQDVLTALESLHPGTPAESAEATDPTDPPTLSSEFLDGHEYVGHLYFPSLDRKLPIMKIQYLEDLQISPCLEKGSPWTNDAVISAHNYPSHFGPIRDWTGGETVIFTDLEGRSIHYTVTEVETVDPVNAEQILDSGHDLLLYTCTPGGARRVTIACDRTET